MNKLETNKNYNIKSFEEIKHIDENGIEACYLIAQNGDSRKEVIALA